MPTCVGVPVSWPVAALKVSPAGGVAALPSRLSSANVVGLFVNSGVNPNALPCTAANDVAPAYSGASTPGSIVSCSCVVAEPVTFVAVTTTR